MSVDTDALVRIRGLRFSYGRNHILRGIDLDIVRGRVVAILGTSGSGKSTLLQLIAGSLRPSAGTVEVVGRDVHTLSRLELYALRRQMGMMFQKGGLFTDLSVFENVAYPLREHTKLPESLVHDIVVMKLHAVGLRGAQNLMPGELSGGMARRVALARAIALDPALIIYDEPFAGLDPITLNVVCNLIRTLNDSLGATSVVVTYDVHEAITLADYLYILGDGVIAAHGPTAAMVESQDPFVHQFLHAEPDGPVRFHFPAKNFRDELNLAPGPAFAIIPRAMASGESAARPLAEPFGSAEGLLDALARSAGAVVAFIDTLERVRFITHEAAAWLGLAPEAVLGKTLKELHEPASYEFFAPRLKRALAGERVQYERSVRHADGRSVWMSVSLSPHRDADGNVVGVFSCSLEVSDLKRTHDALGRALEEIASHMENTPLAVVEFGPDLAIKRWSPQAEGIFGWPFDEVRGKLVTDFSFIHPDSFEHVRELTRDLIEGRERRNRVLARNLTRDGRAIWCEWYSSAFFDENGRLASILSLAQDVTARFEAEEQLKQAAVHDALTGLPNRNALAARLEHALLRVNRAGDHLALLFIDLDRFKKVNDTLGHAAGDEVLRQAAARIRACVREVDTVARLGGDEFVVLLETDVRPDTPGIIGERVRAAFDSPFEYRGAEVRCGASVGVSLYPDHARDPAALLASADQAMYREKAPRE